MTTTQAERDRHDPGPRTALDRLVRAVLRSPLHALLDAGVCELSYAAPRAGHEVTLPVFYAGLGRAVVVVAQGADTKRWWRAFRRPWPVDVRRHGELSWTGIGRVVGAGDRGYQMAVNAFSLAHRLPVTARDRVIVIEPLAGSPIRH